MAAEQYPHIGLLTFDLLDTMKTLRYFAVCDTMEPSGLQPPTGRFKNEQTRHK